MSAKYPAGFLSESFARAMSPVESPSLSVAFEKAAQFKSSGRAPSRGATPRAPGG
jgi:hypothetical protein